jgi:hypothetical protein
MLEQMEAQNISVRELAKKADVIYEIKKGELIKK